MVDFLDIGEATIKDGGVTYCFDFTVFFELVNPSDDIYRPDGDEEVDRGQDEVNFTFAVVRNGLKFDPVANKWVGVPWDDHHLLAEMALDWCRDNPEMHIQAFKAAKNHK